MATFEDKATEREAEVAAQASVMAQRAAIRERAIENLAKIGGEGRLAGPDPTKKYRAFFAPVAKNTKFLVKEGKYEVIKDPNSPRGTRMTERTGDVWLQFIDGIAVMDTADDEDKLKIEWCESHDGICRDIDDPFTEAWGYMKELQHQTAARDATLNPNINLERLLAGDPGARVGHKSVEHAREVMKQRNEEG